MIDVSIVIVNYKTVNLIIDCIKSIKDKTKDINYEIIVVDNNSNDDFEKRLIIEFGNSVNLKCIALLDNVGFGKANNEGFKVANGRNVFCLNPDTILINNAIKILSDYLDANPDVGICGGNLFDEQMNPTLSYMTYLPSITHELDELTHGCLSRLKNGKNTRFNYTDEILSVGYITGADMMIRKSIIDKVGGFSPKFFMYFEETELTYRIKEAGYDIRSIPFVIIQHLEGKSFKPTKINRNRILLSERSRIIYYKLHYSLLYRVAVHMIYLLFLLSRFLFFLIKGDKKAQAYAYRLQLIIK